jgi:hypothetical protein
MSSIWGTFLAGGESTHDPRGEFCNGPRGHGARAKSQAIWIASQWGRSMMDRE